MITDVTNTQLVNVDLMLRKLPKNVEKKDIPKEQSTKPQQHEEHIQKAETKVSDWVSKNTSLLFSVDEQSGARVVKLIDASTNELIRQVPSEEMLKIAEFIDKLQDSGNNDVKGILLKQEV